MNRPIGLLGAILTDIVSGTTMNIWDIVLVIIIIAAVTLAVIHLVRSKRRGQCSCGSCAGCSAPCRKEKDEK
jgi:hypothetical protein